MSGYLGHISCIFQNFIHGSMTHQCLCDINFVDTLYFKTQKRQPVGHLQRVKTTWTKYKTLN